MIVDGPQGRYPIQNGKLAWVSDDAKNWPVPKVLVGLDVATFDRDFDQLRNSR